jgi:hypothetical protein
VRLSDLPKQGRRDIYFKPRSIGITNAIIKTHLVSEFRINDIVLSFRLNENDEVIAIWLNNKQITEKQALKILRLASFW